MMMSTTFTRVSQNSRVISISCLLETLTNRHYLHPDWITFCIIYLILHIINHCWDQAFTWRCKFSNVIFCMVTLEMSEPNFCFHLMMCFARWCKSSHYVPHMLGLPILTWFDKDDCNFLKYMHCIERVDKWRVVEAHVYGDSCPFYSNESCLSCLDMDVCRGKHK